MKKSNPKEEFNRMQQLAGLSTKQPLKEDIHCRIKKILIKEIGFTQDGNPMGFPEDEHIEDKEALNQEDLDWLHNAVLEAAPSWLDTENDEISDDGEVWDTEIHDWVSTKDFAESMIFRLGYSVDDPKYYEIVQKLPEAYNENMVDYLNRNYPEVIEKLAGEIAGLFPIVSYDDNVIMETKDEDEEEENMEDEEGTEGEEDIDLEGGVPSKDEVQEHLEKALEGARALGDEKLVSQIGNTITFFTRNHIVKAGMEDQNIPFDDEEGLDVNI